MMVVFFGKSGSNAINLVKHGFAIKAGFTNEKESLAINEFEKAGIEVVIIDDLEVQLAKYDPKLIVLAGYMKIVPKSVTSRYTIINLHPSLLPHYKGLHAQKRSFEDKQHCGITVHYVNEKLDEGEIIKQVALDPNCSYEQYLTKLKACEHETLPQVVGQLLKQLP